MCIVSIHECGGVNVKCVCVHDYTVYWCVCTTQGAFSCSVIDTKWLFSRLYTFTYMYTCNNAQVHVQCICT